MPHATVLIVDDEEDLRETASRILELDGLEVVQAEGGAQALEILARGTPAIAAVLLDLTMPHMDGEETLRRIQAMGSAVPVILSSGHESETVLRRFAGVELAGVVTKPYQIDTLQGVVRMAIQAAGDPHRSR